MQAPPPVVKGTFTMRVERKHCSSVKRLFKTPLRSPALYRPSFERAAVPGSTRAGRLAGVSILAIVASGSTAAMISMCPPQFAHGSGAMRGDAVLVRDREYRDRDHALASERPGASLSSCGS